jgi:hypothetical protein
MDFLWLLICFVISQVTIMVSTIKMQKMFLIEKCHCTL